MTLTMVCVSKPPVPDTAAKVTTSHELDKAFVAIFKGASRFGGSAYFVPGSTHAVRSHK
jgi:hypothetical protein